MRYQLEYPKLSCRDCEAYHAAGELRELPCKLCPEQRFEPLDDISRRTLEVHNLAISLTPEMGAPPLDFVFRVLGLRLRSPLAREIVERLASLWRLQREAREQQEARQASHEARNGRPPRADQ